jgi:hypothetical protein
MKVWYFVKWQLKRMSSSDLLWYLTCALIGSGLVDYTNIYGKYRVLAGLLIMLVLLMKYVLWDQVKANYKQFQEEQNNLVNLIKNSEK